MDAKTEFLMVYYLAMLHILSVTNARKLGTNSTPPPHHSAPSVGWFKIALFQNCVRACMHVVWCLARYTTLT